MFSGILALPTIPAPQALRDMCLDVSKCTASSAPQLCQANIPQARLKHNMEVESGTPTEATLYDIPQTHVKHNTKMKVGTPAEATLCG